MGADIAEPGSSPLTRGKRNRHRARPIWNGLIPAHAGKTSWISPTSWPGWAHPRSRGENSDLLLGLQSDPGSSPLTRGKHPGLATPITATRLIPAHAGKTDWRQLNPMRAAAHPRSRGENRLAAAQPHAGSGSSPLTRGKHEVLDKDAAARGLIPAHAGKTSIVSSRFRAWRAHPRSRGENIIPASKASSSPGSSPLTRGKRVAPPAPPVGPGLIPAHAGKTGAPRLPGPCHGAHPRSRGENRRRDPTRSHRMGSSPLTRGKLQHE